MSMILLKVLIYFIPLSRKFFQVLYVLIIEACPAKYQTITFMISED